MKIIKSFQSPDFVQDHCPDATWEWGLGDDGRVYWRTSLHIFPNDWFTLGMTGFPFRSAVGAIMSLDIREMKKIIEQFGNLVALL
jgi:hypothetical protein